MTETWRRRDVVVGGGYPPGNDHISPKNGIFEDDFPFPKVGYVNPLEGTVDASENIGKKPTVNKLKAYETMGYSPTG